MRDPAGRRAAQDYDIVVVHKGPTVPVRVREKERVAGIWINADSTAFRSAPSFFAVASSAPIEKIVDEVLAGNAQQVADYRAGKDKAFNFFVGQVMKATRGKANPQQVNEILRRRLAAN